MGEQYLAPAEGWVRCGSCEQVFFAPACLSPTDDVYPPFAQGVERERESSAALDPRGERLSNPTHRASPSSLASPSGVSRDRPDLVSSSAHATTAPHAKGHLLTFRTALITVLVLIALLSLAVLEIYRSRHVLAAMWPELKPALTSFCQPLSCALEMPRDLQAISIESSALDLDPEQPHRYVLSVKLRNHNTYPVAAPGVKLVVLNEQEAAVFEQTFDFSPQAPSQGIEPGVLTPWRVSVFINESLPQRLASGYRVELVDPP